MSSIITDRKITLNSKINLRPLSQQIENGVVVLGYANQFLELPAEGVQFLTWLNEGMSLNAARQRFETEIGPFPEDDLLEIVDAFLESDFIAAIDGTTIPVYHRPAPQPSSLRFSQKWAAVLFSTPMLIVWLVIVIPSVAIWVINPDLWPRHTDFFWSEYYFVVISVGLLVWLVNMVLHELSHWVACRAKGIDATITWTQRLGYIPMSQTVMHNVWAVPRNARYIPLAAGMMFDFLRISATLYLLFAGKVGYVVLPLIFIKFLKFNLLSATIGVTTQFWLFSKMDGYFLLSALFGQRNLQADTYNWVKSRLSGVKKFTPPAVGMKFIYTYFFITLLGGGFIVGSFLLVTLPIKLHLLWDSFLKIGDASVGPLGQADGVAVVTSQLLNYSLLLYVYWRDTWPDWQQNWLLSGRLPQWIAIKGHRIGETQ